MTIPPDVIEGADDELNALISRVATLFGGDVLGSAYLCALSVASVPAETSVELQETFGATELPLDDVLIVNRQALQDALKVELRRLVTPH